MQIELVGAWNKSAGHNRMAVSSAYPAEWSDVTGQRGEEITAGADTFVARGKVSDAQAAAIAADPNYVVLWTAADDAEPPTSLTTPQVNALRAKLTTVLSADVAKLVTRDTAEPITIAEALKEAARYPAWQVGRAVRTGDVVQYAGNLYEAVQGHTPEAAWTPDVARALWKRFYEPADDPWPWVQPLAAFDSYPVGARVTHGGKTWVNELAANVWQPGVAGWKQEGAPPAPGEWKQPTGAHDAYKKGDRVTHKGETWESTVDANVWEPGVVAGLWVKV